MIQRIVHDRILKKGFMILNKLVLLKQDARLVNKVREIFKLTTLKILTKYKTFLNFNYLTLLLKKKKQRNFYYCNTNKMISYIY